MRPLARLLPLLLLLAIASCGGGGGGTGGGGGDDPNPAQAFAANTPLYLEATVKPEGDAKRAIESLSTKFGVEDPGQQIIDALERSADKGESYAKDIEPWLGRRVGLAVGGFDDDPPVVGAVGLKDVDAAKAFVDGKLDGTKGTYKDTTYKVDDDDFLAGVAGDYMLFSDDEALFKRAVDQVESGKSTLADDDRYGDATGDLPDERVGTFYLSVGALIRLVKADPDVASSGAGPVIDKLYGSIQSVAGGVTPYDDRAVLEVQTKTKSDADDDVKGLFSGFGKAPANLKDAPADALGVYGIANVGPTYKAVFDQFAGALGGAALKGQLQTGLGIDLDKDVFSWIGDTTVFVRGTSEADLNGAVMIDAIDEKAAASALPKLVGLAQRQGGLAVRSTQLDGADQAWEAQVPGAPQKAYVARAGGRVVLGYGTEATRMGLQPSSSLDANGGYDRAKQAVDGLDPLLVLDAQKIVGLVERYAGSDPSFAQAKPYLEPLAQLVVGSTVDGDTQTTRIAVSTE